MRKKNQNKKLSQIWQTKKLKDDKIKKISILEINENKANKNKKMDEPIQREKAWKVEAWISKRRRKRRGKKGKGYQHRIKDLVDHICRLKRKKTSKGIECHDKTMVSITKVNRTCLPENNRATHLLTRAMLASKMFFIFL